MTAAAPPRAPTGSAAIVREIARGGLAGLLTGFLVGGVGGRLAMRVSSLIDPAARGARTEAGATVGEFTLEGTVGFVVFVGIFAGLTLATIWVIAQRWLPNRGVYRYLVAALFVAAMGARFAIEGRNIDFLILDPKWAQVGLFVVLAAAAGVVVVRVDRWLERRLPAAVGTALWWYRTIAAVGALLAVPMIVGLFNVEMSSTVSPPRLPGLLLIVVAAASVAAWRFQTKGSKAPPWLGHGARFALAATIVAGFVHLVGEVAHFT